MNEEIEAVLRTIQKAERQIAEAKKTRMPSVELTSDLDDVEMGIEWVRNKLENLKQKGTEEA